jgi:hypothetical protein
MPHSLCAVVYCVVYRGILPLIAVVLAVNVEAMNSPVWIPLHHVPKSREMFGSKDVFISDESPNIKSLSDGFFDEASSTVLPRYGCAATLNTW